MAETPRTTCSFRLAPAATGSGRTGADGRETASFLHAIRLRQDDERILLPSVAGFGLVGFLQVDGIRMGTRSHRRSLPLAANRRPCSDHTTFAGGGPHGLDATISFEQREGCATLRLPQEGRQLAIDGHANSLTVKRLPIEQSRWKCSCEPVLPGGPGDEKSSASSESAQGLAVYLSDSLVPAPTHTPGEFFGISLIRRFAPSENGKIGVNQNLGVEIIPSLMRLRFQNQGGDFTALRYG